MATDALSDVLRAVRLSGAVYFDVAATAPWVAEQPTREMVLPKILPGAGHLIAYHVVTEGRCFAGIIGAEPIAVEAGEVVVFTKGDPHVMSSSPGMRAAPVTAEAFAAAAASPLPFSVNYGGGGPPSVRLVCGFLACKAQPFNLLLDNLPLLAGGVTAAALEELHLPVLQVTKAATADDCHRGTQDADISLWHLRPTISGRQHCLATRRKR
jgi:hypothetical protein